jgi:YVTN family beta-propeller protein
MSVRPVRPGWLLALLAVLAGAGALAARRAAGPVVTAPRPLLVSKSQSDRSDKENPDRARNRIIRDGLQVEFEIAPVSRPDSNPARTVREGQDVRIAFRIIDTAGNAPLAKLYPSAWAVPHPDNAPALSARDALLRSQALINGGLFDRPALDLNTYHVLTLNHDNTITVVDPLFSFGGTKLLALVPLPAGGEDWMFGPGARQVFVALAETNQVAIVDTQSWKITASVPAGIRPHRLALQPDGRYVWVAGGVEGHPDSGVTVLRESDGSIAARIRTGPGRHDLALSDDSRYAFVTNTEAGSVAVVDALALRTVATIPTGRRPTSIAYSAQAAMAYVTDAVDGTISAIDPVAGRLVNRVTAEPGLGQIRFSSTGGAGFVINTQRNLLHVLDPASNRIVQTAQLEAGPDQIAFSSDFAYIRHSGSVNVVMVSLKTAGKAGAPLSVLRFPAGERPPGSQNGEIPADSIIPAPGARAMLVANAADKSVYYYKEGLAAPMGTFSNYKREPRAILVLDRSMRERAEPGVYETVARLDRAGRFDVIFFLDQPRIAHAFPFEVEADPALELARKRGKVKIEPILAVNEVDAGKTLRPLFQLIDLESGTVKSGVKNLEILMFRVGGGWQDRRPAREIAAGIYGAEFVPDRPGVHEIFVVFDSAGLKAEGPRGLSIRVVETAAGGPGDLRALVAHPQSAGTATAEKNGSYDQ